MQSIVVHDYLFSLNNNISSVLLHIQKHLQLFSAQKIWELINLSVFPIYFRQFRNGIL